jgi:hypothetical protein
MIREVEAFPLYWGSACQQDRSLITLSARLNGFLTYIINSPLMDQLAEYSVANYPIKHGVYVNALLIDDPPVPACAEDGR